MSTGACTSELCSKCGGTGWEPRERGVVPCECQGRKRMAQFHAESRIPPRFAECSLGNYQVSCPSLQRALMYTRRFADEYPLVDVGLLYMGCCGVGKTHLAAGLLRAVIGKGFSGLFYDFRDLLKAIQDSYNPLTRVTEQQILAPIYNTDVLVLDELGASKPTEWVQDTVTQIINTRYNERRITIFTTNYLDVAPSASYGETLADRVGARVRSRLKEMCRLVFIEGPDFRESKRSRYFGGETGRP
jgi:DNA replication protein DnaC